MDNLDMIFLGCFSSFYCHVYLGLRAVQCDVLGIKVPFKFSLCQSEWQDADHGLICSALLGISKILPPLELPLVFVFVLFLFFFFFPVALYCTSQPWIQTWIHSVVLPACSRAGH